MSTTIGVALNANVQRVFIFTAHVAQLFVFSKSMIKLKCFMFSIVLYSNYNMFDSGIIA